jgi:hypothetical protein
MVAVFAWLPMWDHAAKEPARHLVERYTGAVCGRLRGGLGWASAWTWDLAFCAMANQIPRSLRWRSAVAIILLVLSLFAMAAAFHLTHFTPF